MKYTILVVDDQQENIAAILNMLKSQDNNLQIIGAVNGEIACDLAIKKHPDLILMDWEMPVMSGIDAVKYLKSLKETKDIPIIMVTALISSEHLQEALEAGAIDYVRKPIDRIELNARINSALLLFDSYKEIKRQKEELRKEKELSDALLLNILPKETAEELKTKGQATPRFYRRVSVLFADFQGFTKVSENLSPNELVYELDKYFVKFDEIIEQYYIEKIKTIGDAYMCAAGLPIRNKSNPIDTVLAALEIQNFMNQLNKEKKAKNLPVWELRLGIHTGAVVSGVVGKKKFAYDIWGDSVNIASRMESAGEVGKVNISETTYELVKDYFTCSYRGKIKAKNIGKIDMYFVTGIKPEFSVKANGLIPNKKFQQILAEI